MLAESLQTAGAYDGRVSYSLASVHLDAGSMRLDAGGRVLRSLGIITARVAGLGP